MTNSFSDSIEQWGERVIAFESLDSTSIKAKELAKSGAPEGSVVTARVQGNGYGRLGREWSSPDGGMWLSIIIRPKKQFDGLSLLFSLWISQFIDSHTGIETAIHWPNDIFANGSKLGGVLLEASSGNANNYIIVGIGINVNNSGEELDESFNAISLFDLTGNLLRLDYFIEDLLIHLQFNYETLEKNGFMAFRDDITEKCPMLGKKVRVTTDIEEFDCEALDIGPEGELIVKDGQGVKKLWSCSRIRIL